MIRTMSVPLVAGITVSGCASWKKPGKNQNLQPGTFSISKVSVNAFSSRQAYAGISELMRNAANKSRVAYNQAVGGEKASYQMLLTLDQITVDGDLESILPVTENKIDVTAVLMTKNSGKVVKRLQLSHNLIAIDPEETRERQLLRGIIPKAFNKIHGLRETPEDVRAVVSSRDFFDPYVSTRSINVLPGENTRQQTEYTNQNVEVDYTPGEPKVISCAVC